MPHRQSVTTQAETTDPLINSKNNQHAFPACFALNQQHRERNSRSILQSTPRKVKE
jgi:hypothetical protein